MKLKHDLPYTKDWSAAPDFLHAIADYCLEHQPETVLECSSGTTSLVLARCCQINTHGKVYSLENGEEYVDETRKQLDRFQLGSQASVIHAPLDKIPLNGVDYLWYSTKSLPTEEIDMLVIDGPPGFIQKHSRYPALPVLYDQLSDGCKVFLDDASRTDEQEIVQLWQSICPGIVHEFIDTERGCSVLTVRKNS